MKAKMMSVYCECGALMLELASDDALGVSRMRCSSTGCPNKGRIRYVPMVEVVELPAQKTEESYGGTTG